MNVYATRPWAYPMTPMNIKKVGRPSTNETPKQIKKCLNCKRDDCTWPPCREGK